MSEQLLKFFLWCASHFTHRDYEELLTKATTKDEHSDSKSNVRYL